jgi:hypothetical protein
MARTRTLLQLRTEVRDRGDLSSDRHTDAQVTRYINQSIAELYDIILEVTDDYWLESDDVTVSSGTATYALSGLTYDFYLLKGIDVQDGSTWRPLRRFNFSERNQNQTGSAEKWSTRYRIMGSNIRLRPTPQWSGTIRVWYIPVPTELSADGDTFDGVSGWEEYVIVDSIIKARVRDEEDVSDQMLQKSYLVERIRKAAAAGRDSSEPNRVRDVAAERTGHNWPSYHNP